MTKIRYDDTVFNVIDIESKDTLLSYKRQQSPPTEEFLQDSQGVSLQDSEGFDLLSEV